jgi:ornithine cyclodeaminase
MIALMQNTLPYIDADELFRLIPLPDALDALRTCFAASPSHVDRVQSQAGGGEFLVMPAAAGDAAGVKLVGIQPANPARGKPIIKACTCSSTCASVSPWPCSTAPR